MAEPYHYHMPKFLSVGAEWTNMYDQLMKELPGLIDCSLLLHDIRLINQVINYGLSEKLWIADGLAVLTLCKLCFSQPHFVAYKKLLEQDLLNHMIAIFTANVNRFVRIAVQDVLVSIQRCLLQEPQMESLHLLELSSRLQEALRHSLNNHDTALSVACTDILCQIFSKHYGVTNIGRRHMSAFVELWPHVVQNDCELLIGISIKCLGKIIKSARENGDGPCMIACCDRIHPTLTALLLSTNSSLIWRPASKALIWLMCFEPSDADMIPTQPQTALACRLISDCSVELVVRVPVCALCTFTGQQSELDTAENRDNSLLRSVTLVTMQAIARSTCSEPDPAKALQVVTTFEELHNVVNGRCGKPPSSSVCSWFYFLFLDQDDKMSAALACCLTLTSLLRKRFSCLAADSLLHLIDPLRMFAVLLENIAYDHSVILDLIVSPETLFLTYFVGLLKYLISAWPSISLSALLDKELEDEASPHISSVISLTQGLESLMSYESESSVSSDSSSSSESVSALPSQHRSDLRVVLKCLEQIRELVVAMFRKDIFPFNPEPLIALLKQIHVLSQLADITY